MSEWIEIEYQKKSRSNVCKVWERSKVIEKKLSWKVDVKKVKRQEENINKTVEWKIDQKSYSKGKRRGDDQKSRRTKVDLRNRAEE